jgi:hypothetical protein
MCTNLTSITIPNSVTSIGNYVFEYCTSLETITINRPEGTISGEPWGAPDSTEIKWEP